MRFAQLAMAYGVKSPNGETLCLDPVWHVKQTDANRHSKTLYEHISTDIWVKPEPKGARCLIGPYSDFAFASKELKRSKLATFEQAFFRQVVKTSAQQPVMKAKPTTATVAPAANTAESEASAPKPASKPKSEENPLHGSTRRRAIETGSITAQNT